MELLRQHDIVAVLRLLKDIYAIQDLDSFPEQVGSALQRLIPSDYYVYAEVESQTRKTVRIVSHPAIDSVLPDFRAIFERCGHQNPLLAAHQGHTGALKISDFLAQRQLRRLALYSEFLRPGGVRYQMSVVLPAQPGILRGIVLNRGTRDFSERERLLLDLVRPHLIQAWQNGGSLDLRRRALEAAGHEIVCLSEIGRVTFFSGGVSSLLSAYLQGSISRGERMPEPIGHWVREQQERFNKVSDNLPAARPFVVDLDDKRLCIRFLYGGGAGQDDLLLMDEQQVHVSPASLTAIGLSRREAEVLSLVMRGRVVAEISQMLAITTGTVEKHLEHVYLKLDVHNRAAAVARALEALRVRE